MATEQKTDVELTKLRGRLDSDRASKSEKMKFMMNHLLLLMISMDLVKT